ncbi:uncharacterized protein LOC109806199 [Cajanus cajan]|uniref:uncharacterized protein LOC109806199 n=1 Tax=Cajanus cajan TaxID=3821 RepID=UPI00098DC94E|nr:uncharacterized protein LOC109806199 [Cajanus cajan]
MANPISIRPWSRLASLRSPQSEISQPSLKPTNTTSHDNNQSATATKSLPTTPHDVHSPIQSPKLKLTTRMTFSPSKLKDNPQIEAKIEVEEVTIKKPNDNGQNEKQVTNKENETKGKCFHTPKFSGSEGIRAITISGENTGAYMQITKSKKKRMYVNSNVQCVNNSMVFNASLTHHDPGVYLAIPKKPFGE